MEPDVWLRDCTDHYEHIAAYALGPKMILTRLCVAVSAVMNIVS